MLKWIAVMLALASGAAHADHEPLQTHDVVLISVTLSLIAADTLTAIKLGSVRDLNYEDGHRYKESGPISHLLWGKYPETWQFAVSGMVAGGSTFGLCYVLPERVRWIPVLAVGLIEAEVVHHNLRVGFSFPL